MDFGGTATLTTTAGVITPTTSATFASGVLTQPVTVTLAGTNRVITATSDIVSGVSNGFTVTAGSAFQFVFANVGTQTAGAVFTVTVTARDAFSNTATGFSGTATLTTTAGVITPTTTANFANGVLTQPVTVTLAGTNRVITATSGAVNGVSNGFIVVQPFSITKFVTSDSVTAGEQISYTVRVTNTSTIPLSAVSIIDTLPVTVSLITSSTTGLMTCSGVGTIVCTRGTDLAVNSSVTLIVTGTVSATALSGEQLVNTAQVGGSNVSIVQTAQVSTTVQRSALLTVTKSVTPTTVVAGNLITYTVRITNTGPSAASGLRLTDTLPITVSGVTSSTFGGLSCGGSSIITCTLSSDLNVNGSVVLTVTGIVSATAAHNQPIVNSVIVSATDASITRTATVTTTVLRSAVLTVTKSVTPTTVIAGNLITYTVRITNTGPSVASGLRLTDTLPITVSGVTSSTFGGLSCGGSSIITCTLSSDLGVNGSVVLTVTGTVSATAPNNQLITNTVAVSATGAAIVHTAQVSVTVVQPAGLSVTKVATPTVATAGQQITYTVRITNTGPSTLNTVRLTDTLPVTVSAVTSSTTGGLACTGVGTITCTLTTLGSGSGVTLTITGTVSAGAVHGQAITNIVTATATEVAGMQTAQVSTTVQRSAVLTVTKSVTPTTVIAGNLITYTVRITNTGPSVASGLRLTDTLPITVSGVTSSTFGGLSCGGSSIITCTLSSDLGVNDSVVLTVTGTVSATALHGEVITNTVAVSATEVSVVQTAQVTTTVQQPAGLSVTKSVTPTTVIAGNLITYTVRITNTGPTTLNTIRLTDTLPLTVSVVASSTGGLMDCGGSGTITCTMVSLNAGSGVTLTITGTVSSGALDGELLTNSVEVSADEVSVAESAQASATVQRLVMLEVTKVAAPDPVNAGEEITYTVRITNTGPSVASNILLTDSLPITVMVSSVVSDTDGLDCAGVTPITCSAASLGANASVALTITGTISPTALDGEVLTNSVEVSADEVSVVESAQASVTVNTLADLEITKSETYTDTVVGAIITYTLQITNSGPSYASGVYITDSLPISVAFGSVIAITPENLFGTGVEDAGVITWMTDTLPLVHNATIVFTGTITGTGTLAEMVNSVEIASTTTDDVPGNNSATTAGFEVAGSGMMAAVADLWLGVDSASAAIAVDAPAVYLFRAGNRGPIGVAGATVVIQSAAELDIRLLTEPHTACPRSGDGFACALPLLQPGDEIGIAVTFLTALPGTLDSVWTIEAAVFDLNPADNQLTQRWVVGEAAQQRIFLPILQSQADTERSQSPEQPVEAEIDPERNRPEETEIYLPAVGNR